MDLHARLDAAVCAANKSGEMLRHHGNISITQKAANDYVTEMDRKSEMLIRETLLGKFPEDGFFGEETGGTTDVKGRWIVDPIDGTQSFMRGQHGYCISIAYEYAGEMVLGCVYAPDTDEMFTAIRGEGAYLNGKRIHVSSIANPSEALCHYGYNHREPELRQAVLPLFPPLIEEISDLRRYGTAALALCTVAAGRSELYFEHSLYIYDIAAGVVILREAGGTVTGWKGEDVFDHCDPAASNGPLHDFLLGKLQAAKL